MRFRLYAIAAFLVGVAAATGGYAHADEGRNAEILPLEWPKTPALPSTDFYSIYGNDRRQAKSKELLSPKPQSAAVAPAPSPQPQPKPQPQSPPQVPPPRIEAENRFPVAPRMDFFVKQGSDRRLTGTELFAPLTWNGSLMSFADLRFVAGDDKGREVNAGLGLRRVFGESGFILGGYGFFDRRRSSSGNYYSQVTGGAELLSEGWDFRVNGYAPLTREKILWEAPGLASLSLSGNAIMAQSTFTQMKETPMWGTDGEIGRKLFFLEGSRFEDTRVYLGAYHFGAEGVKGMTGGRARIETAPLSWLRFSAEGQNDNIRGATWFTEARVRVPLDFWRAPERRARPEGILKRLDTRIERDVDVVTNAEAKSWQTTGAIENAATGANQKVYVVDNSAAAGGDGTAENPFSTLAAVQSAAGAHDIIYVKAGDGTTSGMNAGITLAHEGQKLIGSGVPLAFDATAMRMVIPGILFEGQTILPATSAPALTNASGNAVTVTGESVEVAGVKAQNASDNGVYVYNANGATIHDVIASGNANDGIRVEANGANVTGASIERATATGNRNGIRFYAQNNGSLTAKLERSAATGNSQHGVIVYDDSTTGSVNADLGGGSLDSVGLNTLRSNTLEDLALETDGATLQAQNNWWGQAGGPLATQIYKGAPMDTGLVGNWTFDDGSGTTARDRSGSGQNATLTNGPTWTTGQVNGALSFDGVNDYVQFPTSYNTNNLTASFWFKPSNQGGGKREIVISNGYDNGATDYRGWHMESTYYGDSMFRALVAANGNIRKEIRSGLLANSTWYQATLVHDYDNSIARLYINGTQVGTVAVVGYTPFSSWNMRSGINSWSTGFNMFFTGLVDDMRIYNRALSASEVSELYRMDASGTATTTGALSSAP